MSDIAEISAFRVEPMPLEECLLELAKYGNPRVCKMDNGWYSRIDVFVTGEGVNFEVKSEHNHRTAKDAANECYQLLHKAFKKIKEGSY